MTPTVQPTNPDAGTAPTQSRAAAFLDGRVSVRTAFWLFWTSMVAFLCLNMFLPKNVADSRWFIASWRIVFHLSVALWVAADARAHNFEDGRVRSYATFAAALPEFTVPIY